MIWRREILGTVLLLGALLGAGQPAAAQEATAPATFGEFMRAQGYDVTDAEIAYLNADEHVQVVYAEALLNVDALARVAPAEQSAEWRQALLGELTRLAEADLTPERLAERLGRQEADTFDLLCHLAFGAPLRTRRERPGALVQLDDGRYAITGELVAIGGPRQLLRYCRERIRRATEPEERAWWQEAAGVVSQRALR